MLPLVCSGINICYRKKVPTKAQTRIFGAWSVVDHLINLVSADDLGQMLEFCQSVNPNLEDYEADGVCPLSLLDAVKLSFANLLFKFQAWPTLLDDFVIWKKTGTTHGVAGVDDDR